MRKLLSIIPFFITISAVMLLSCNMVNTIFATPTPTSTSTPTITPTSTITPSPIPSFTPTPVPTGVKTESLTNGTTLVTDFDNKYQLTLPAGWIVIPLTTDDLSAIISELAESNEELSKAAEAFETLDSDFIKIVALNEDPTYIQNDFGTNLTVAAFEDTVLTSMPMAFVTGALEESFAQNGAKVLSEGVNITTNSNGVEVGTIDVEQETVSATGSTLNIAARYSVFLIEGKLILVQLATPIEFQDVLFPTMDDILESITLLE